MSMKFEGTEFDLIRYIKKKTESIGFIDPDGAVGIGDDAAIFKGFEGFGAISSDMLVEGVDFEFEWANPHSLGVKALEVSLSDIAAMGARPQYSLLSLAIPERLFTEEFLSQFVDGYVFSANRSSIRLIGGDISKTTGPLVVDSTVLGKTTRSPILRSGAKAGDLIYVSGELGGAAGGLELLKKGFESNDPVSTSIVRRQLEPQAKVELGMALGNSAGISSMIDISDGLCGDLYHLLEASRTGAEIDLESIPIQAGIGDLIGQGRITGEYLGESPDGIALDRWMALAGGEDFELLFTVTPENESELIASLERSSVTKIGTITNEMYRAVARKGLHLIELPTSSFTHF